MCALRGSVCYCLSWDLGLGAWVWGIGNPKKALDACTFVPCLRCNLTLLAGKHTSATSLLAVGWKSMYSNNNPTGFASE